MLTEAINQTVYIVLMNDDVTFDDVIIKTEQNFNLAPSNIDLAGNGRTIRR